MSKRLLIRDQQGERERLLVGTMTVGRDTRCDISDADPLLSRRHAEFVCRPDSLLVRDLNSRNGVAVNGVRVQEAVLRPGDVVKVARLVMTYLGDVESARLAAPPVTGGPSEAQKARMRAANTEKIQSKGPGSAGVADAPVDDDRTRLAAPRTEQRSGVPEQVAVARMTPSLPVAPMESPGAPSAVDARDDLDRTRPIFRREEARTDAPVLPRPTTRATAPVPPDQEATGQGPPIELPEAPPVLVSPPVAAAPAAPVDQLADWSLDLGARPPVPLPARAPAASDTAGRRVIVATVGLSLLVFALTAVPMIVWVAYHRDVPAILWNFAVVLGPSLLGSIAAGLGLAWWLRRTMRGG